MSNTARRMQMAASNVGGGIEFVGKAQNSNTNGGDVTVTLPSGTQSGDVMIAVHGEASLADFRSSMSMSGSGWTALYNQYHSEASVINLETHYKVVGTETSITADGSGYSSNGAGLQVMVFRNVSTVGAEYQGTIRGNTVSWPNRSLTAGNVYVYNAGLADRYNLMTAPSVTDLEEFHNFLRTESYDLYQGQAYKLAESGGFFDPTDWTWTGVYDYRRVAQAYNIVRLEP